MRKTTYVPIREIHFKHKVFNAIKGLKIIPDDSTQHILNNYKLQHKVIDDKFYILQTFVDDKPLIPIDEKLLFRFHMHFDYLSFAHKTDIQLYNPKDSCLHIELLNDDKTDLLIGDSNLIDMNPNDLKVENIAPLDRDQNNPGVLADGVYKNIASDSNFALYRSRNRDFGGYLNVEIAPESLTEGNLFTLKFNPRNVYLQYVIIDKSQNYNDFSILDNEGSVKFSVKQQDASYIFTSEETVTVDLIEKLSYSLMAKRKNGMEITIKDNLPLPSTKNISKYSDSQEFCLKIFFYV